MFLRILKQTPVGNQLPSYNFEPKIVIQEIPTGQIVDVADYITQDTESLSNEQEEAEPPDSYS